MNKAALAAAALVGVSALTGATALSGSATADGVSHTKRLELHNTAYNSVGKYSSTGTDVARSPASGEIVGYDSFSGRFYPKKNKLVYQVAFALKGGIILGRIHIQASGNTEKFSGRILKGAGKYAGIAGTISGHNTIHNARETNHVTLHYRI